MSAIRHITHGAVKSSVASSVEASVFPCTIGYAPVEEGGGGGGSTTYTFTINPAWFTYDPGEEYGGPQVVESINAWSNGIYWEFIDQYSGTLLILKPTGGSYLGGTEVADLPAFQAALGAALDTVDSGLDVTLTGDNSEIFTITFTDLPVIASSPIVGLNFRSNNGSSPAFTNPAELVTSP